MDVANTQTVTIIFTDLVGSTALLSRVGEERAEALRREHLGILRDAVARSGCREVKNLGDGLMIVADSAARGAACAVEIQQSFDARNRRTDEPLVVRVGVSLGDADVEDGDYFGVPVVEAARLCARAEGGEILVANVVRHLSGTRIGLVFEPVGPLELKGLDEPLQASRVLWAPIDPMEKRPSFPARLEAARSETFVGRSAESERLADAWKGVVGGGGLRSMLLAGEPGIGKTTLAARFASDAYEQGAAVVYGRCDEDLGIPYQPWIEALAQLVEGIAGRVVAAHVADRGPHLARVVPQLAKRMEVEVPASQDSDSERYVLFGCVADLLARASIEHPVLVVLDDLHWADRPSLQLLRHLHSAETPMRVGVLGTFRDSDVVAGDPVSDLLAALHREGGTERIALSGLSDLDLLALLESVAGHEMDEEGMALRDALLGETAGNPFFVGEMVRHLVETRAIYQRDDGRWAAAADLRAVGLPVSVKEVVGRRLARLGPDTERALALASVIGRDFDIALLATVAHMDEDSLVDLCDAAAANRVLQATDRADRYTFAHALIEHTLYDSLSPARRARAHCAVGEALEAQLGADPRERTAELAYHWAAAVQPADSTKAIRYAQLAGARALDQLAPDEALRWYGQALDLFQRTSPVDDRQRAELLVGLGEAQRQCGIAEHREILLEAAGLADRAGDANLLVRAVLNNNRGWSSVIGGVDHERTAAIDRALDLVGDSPTAERARLLALATAERLHVDDLDERVALAEKAVAVARDVGDPATFAFAVQRTFLSIHHPSTLALRASWIDEMLGVAHEVMDPSVLYYQHNYAWVTAMERGDGAAVDAHLARGAEVAARTPHTAFRWTLMFNEGWLRGLRGDLAEYERLAEAGLSFGTENGEPDAFTIYAAQLANVRTHQGRLHELVPLIEHSLNETPTLRVYRAVLAHAKARSGMVEEARQMLDEDGADGFRMSKDYAWSAGMASWVEAASLVGSVDAAQHLRAQIHPYHDQITCFEAGFHTALSHCLGLLDQLLGDYESAERWFSEALELHERVRSPILVAQTQAAWAALLASRNQADDKARARDMATAALDAALAGGYGYIETDARLVLERLA
jgi:class 3 adenylate cyclase/tetratricopeptide (TPR) repeat protein